MNANKNKHGTKKLEQPEVPPYKPSPPVKQPCEHKWVFQRSDYSYEPNPSGVDEYMRYDTYYCERCLKVEEKQNKHEESRIVPYWYSR